MTDTRGYTIPASPGTDEKYIGMTVGQVSATLTENMVKALSTSERKGGRGLAFGSRATINALRRRGLLSGCRLTMAGWLVTSQLPESRLPSLDELHEQALEEHSERAFDSFLGDEREDEPEPPAGSRPLSSREVRLADGHLTALAAQLRGESVTRDDGVIFRVGDHVRYIGQHDDGTKWKITGFRPGPFASLEALDDPRPGTRSTALYLNIIAHVDERRPGALRKIQRQDGQVFELGDRVTLPESDRPDQEWVIRELIAARGDTWVELTDVPAPAIAGRTTLSRLTFIEHVAPDADELMRRAAARAQYDTLRAFRDVLAAWIETSRENHDASVHSAEVEPCWLNFHASDVRGMISDVAKALGAPVPPGIDGQVQ